MKKSNWNLAFLWSAICIAPHGVLAGQPLGTAFTYQGQLKQDGAPLNGTVDLEFRLFDAATGGSLVGSPITRSGVVVTNGLFTVDLDFGLEPFNGQALFLEVAVQTVPADGFTTLAPRRQLTSTPHALWSAAPWQTGGTSLFYLGGNVGVGTPTPTQELTIAGDVLLSVSGQYKGINGALGFLSNLGSNSPGVKLESTTDVEVHLDTDNNSVQPSSFRIYANGETRASGLPILLVSDEGNVNIGGTNFSPNHRLEVAGITGGSFDPGDPLTEVQIVHYLQDDVAPGGFSGATAALVFQTLMDNPSPEPRTETEASIRVEANQNDSQLMRIIVESDNTDLTLETAMGEAMRVDATKMIGIGTASPTNPLHVQAAGTSSGGAPGFGEVAARFRSTVTGHSAISVDASTNNDPILYLAENGSAVWGIRNDADAGDDLQIRFHRGGANDTFMAVEPNGNVGIGTAGRSIDGRLHVQSDNARTAKFDRFTSDGEIVAFARDDVVVGSISVAGAVVSYNAFTGSHYAWSAEALAPGVLVSMTGENRRFGDRDRAEVVYGVRTTVTANDPACLGAYLGPLESTRTPDADNPLLVAAVGNGELCIVDRGGGDIEPGDYLISSDVPGCAMKDDPLRYSIGNVVARAAERVQWNTVCRDKPGGCQSRISVLFGSFARTGSLQTVKPLATQANDKDAEIAQLKDRLTRLEGLLHSSQVACVKETP